MKKRLVLSLVAMACASLSFANGASAATSVYGSVDGHSTSGYLSMGSRTAYASTSCDAIAGLYVYVSYTYINDDLEEETVSSNSGNASTSVSTTATANHLIVQSVSAYASHSVTYGTAYWSDMTTS